MDWGGVKIDPPYVFLRYVFLRLRYIATTFCKLLFQLLTSFAKKIKFVHIFFSDLCGRCQIFFFEIVDFQVLLIQNHQIAKSEISSSKLVICIWNLVKCKMLGCYLMKKNFCFTFPIFYVDTAIRKFSKFPHFLPISTSSEEILYVDTFKLIF